MFTFNGKKIHYEEYGEGKPLLMLNGIMMSTKSWASFIENFSKNNKLYLLDFLDQGQSDDLEGEYTHDIQIELIKSFLEFQKIEKINICGISYGAEVGLGFAVKYPQYIERLVLFNGAGRTAPLLRDIGRSWNESAKLEGGYAYYLNTIPVIYSDSYYENNQEWMQQRQEILVPYFAQQRVKDRLVRLTNSSEPFNVLDKLDAVDMPVLIVSSDKDFLIPIGEQKMVAERLKNASHVVLPNCGHASMYEEPMLFSTLTLGFINSESDKFAI